MNFIETFRAGLVFQDDQNEGSQSYTYFKTVYSVQYFDSI